MNRIKKPLLFIALTLMLVINLTGCGNDESGGVEGTFEVSYNKKDGYVTYGSSKDFHVIWVCEDEDEEYAKGIIASSPDGPEVLGRGANVIFMKNDIPNHEYKVDGEMLPLRIVKFRYCGEFHSSGVNGVRKAPMWVAYDNPDIPSPTPTSQLFCVVELLNKHQFLTINNIFKNSIL
ncbi:MAG: hypothetical protein IKX24_04015 [Prevotella sp.]|nr:hypothetical protein [Prevotella sp.]